MSFLNLFFVLFLISVLFVCFAGGLCLDGKIRKKNSRTKMDNGWPPHMQPGPKPFWLKQKRDLIAAVVNVSDCSLAGHTQLWIKYPTCVLVYFFHFLCLFESLISLSITNWFKTEVLNLQQRFTHHIYCKKGYVEEQQIKFLLLEWDICIHIGGVISNITGSSWK